MSKKKAVVVLEQLSIQEQQSLEQNEAVIRQGCQTFLEVGEALLNIRDNRLYRALYPTFEQYCRERWGWSRQRSHQMIDAAQVVKALPEDCKHSVTNESTARAIKKVAPEKRADAVRKARDIGPVTQASIAEATVKVIDLDKTGHKIPDDVLPDWKRAADFSATLGDLQRIKRIVQTALEA